MTVIELCAYVAAHITDDDPWRCVVCDKVTKHADADIMRHLEEGHGYPAERLKKEHKDGIFLYPEVVKSLVQ